MRRSAIGRSRGLGGFLMFAILVALMVPTTQAASPSGWTFRAPYSGISSTVGHRDSIVGCVSTATARDLVHPRFFAATGRIHLGVGSSTGCTANSGSSYANASASLRLAGPSFVVGVGGNYWVNASWELTFTFNFSSNFAGASYGASRYWLRINVSLEDTTTSASQRVGYPYWNGTGTGGCCSNPFRYANVRVTQSSTLSLRAGDRYEFRAFVSLEVSSAAYGSLGRAATTLAVGSEGNPSFLRSLTVR